MAAAVERDAALRFDLWSGGRVTCDSGENGGGRRGLERGQDENGRRRDRVRALIAYGSRGLVLRPSNDHCRAMMPAVSPAADGQVRVRRAVRKERQCEGKCEERQQRDGQQAAHEIIIADDARRRRRWMCCAAILRDSSPGESECRGLSVLS